MIIVSGALYVDPAGRADYLATCDEVIRLAREAPGCHDFYLSADPMQTDRINVYERWETDEELMAFRGSGPDQEQTVAIRDASMARYRISAVEEP